MAVTIFLGACALEPDVGHESAAVESENALSVNALSVNALSVNALSVNALSVNALSVNGLALDQSSTNLADTSDGRELLKYIARCALPQGIDLIAEVGGQTYTFPGRLGLAPDWADHPLDAAGRRWMTACLLAHTNYFGITVPISLRGEHPALVASADEQGIYPVPEAAFFGDLFADPPYTASCIGPHQSGDSPYLDLRVCAEPDGSTSMCGFGLAGYCDWWTVCSSAASDGHYRDCRLDHDMPRVGEVITVFLADQEL